VITALALLGYAACVAWCAPALLTPLTRGGASVRAGLAAWLAALASAVGSAAVASAFSVRTAAADWPRLTQDLCRSVAGAACTPQVYGSILYQAAVAALAVLLTLGSAAALCRYGRRVRRSRAQTRGHAQAALLVGRPLGGTPAGRRARTVLLDDPRPAAYCAAGRPAAIVVTSGALGVLDRPQLQAVLAHERAHLAHGHHALAVVTRGLAAALPGIPLFTQGAAEVARLTEMSADDTAARSTSPGTVAAALVALASGAAVPGPPHAVRPPAAGGAGAVGPRAGLAAAAYAVPARVERLLRPSGHAGAVAGAAALTAAAALLVAAPSLLAVFAAG
jgi:Zn-dependent protease with chaperone function